MGTKVGIVYATASKIVRRLIVPSDDRELSDPLHVGPGESLLTLPSTAITQQSDMALSVQQATGVTPPSARCAVINPTGHVIDIRMVDPTIDLPGQGRTLIQTDIADKGWTWDAISSFQAPVSIISTVAVSTIGVAP